MNMEPVTLVELGIAGALAVPAYAVMLVIVLMVLMLGVVAVALSLKLLLDFVTTKEIFKGDD